MRTRNDGQFRQFEQLVDRQLALDEAGECVGALYVHLSERHRHELHVPTEEHGYCPGVCATMAWIIRERQR